MLLLLLVWVNEKRNVVEKDAINAVFKYVEDNPDVGINVPNKVLVDTDETDVYLAVDKGRLMFLSRLIKTLIFKPRYENMLVQKIMIRISLRFSFQLQSLLPLERYD